MGGVKVKVEKISPNKFRLTFSDEDLRDFGVDFENIRYNSEDAQELFWELIERADIEEEFFKDNAQIVVEAVATKNDGLTMTVTRVSDNGKKTPKIRNRKNKGEKHADISPVIFSFDDFENLVQACKYIENIFVGISRLYKIKLLTHYHLPPCILYMPTLKDSLHNPRLLRVFCPFFQLKR